MPNYCDGCWALDDSGDYPMCRITHEQRGYNFNTRKYKMSHCLSVEVPTPHGRLIDVDILLDTIRYGAEIRDFCNKKCKSQDCRNCIIKSVYKIIREAPTIIEAEE